MAAYATAYAATLLDDAECLEAGNPLPKRVHRISDLVEAMAGSWPKQSTQPAARPVETSGPRMVRNGDETMTEDARRDQLLDQAAEFVSRPDA
jgi:hypothetical protein